MSTKEKLTGGAADAPEVITKRLQDGREEYVEGTADRVKRLDYYREYNAEHSEALLEKKKTRYQTDPVYRAAIIKRSREAYQKQKKHKTKGYGVLVCPHCKRPMPRVIRPVLMRVDGKRYGIDKSFEVFMYAIGELSKKLMRQQRTVKAWIRDGVIPESRYRNDKQRRLWTQDQVEMFERVIKKYDLKPPADYKKIGFIDEIKKEWDKLMPLGIQVSKYTQNNGGYYRREDNNTN
jgi:hypothetical protein